MTEQQQQPESIPATEAQAKINALTADKGWVDRFMNGDATATNEFHTLSGAIVGGGSAEDIVASVMAGRVPEFGNSVERQMAVTVEHFREIGITDDVTKEFLSGRQVTPQEYQAVASLKRQLMGDPDFVKNYLGGNVEARRKMTTINAVLVNGIELEKSV